MSTQTPRLRLLDGRPWTPSDCTDITQTWKRFGWKPTPKRTIRKNNRTYKKI